MAQKYGTPGQTDNEGFDPYRDSASAGIYGSNSAAAAIAFSRTSKTLRARED